MCNHEDHQGLHEGHQDFKYSIMIISVFSVIRG